MCGIVGIVGNSQVSDRILASLKKLEYRGYDSSGIATLNHGKIHIQKAVGKIVNLENSLKVTTLNGDIGIGHTRWATHGLPSDINAHPHQAKRVAIVHNGIIENHSGLRSRLKAQGCKFHSDTDTEVISVLINYYLEHNGLDEVAAVRKAFSELEGAFAVGVIFEGNEHLMIGMKHGAPLAVGYGEGENYLGSDAMALASFTNKISYLEDGDIAILSNDNIRIIDANGNEQKRNIRTLDPHNFEVGKGKFNHFMHKEIYEQPAIVNHIFENYYSAEKNEFNFESKYKLHWSKIKHIYIIACGTSYHSAIVAKYYFERYGITVEVDIASEFRYRSINFAKHSLAIFISQSGETADTLAALKYAVENKVKTLALVNVTESAMGNTADICLPILAGVEIGVASTKAFTAQLMILSMMAVDAGRHLGFVDVLDFDNKISEYRNLSIKLEKILTQENDFKVIANTLLDAKSAIYIGRGTSYAVAMEGALKLKELSYIHAEGLPAGELKHGSIALIDEKMPIFALAPNDELISKTFSNVHEIYSRKGRIIALCNKASQKEFADVSKEIIIVPDGNRYTNPILFALPVQLIAYHAACALGKDIDQPRNLAKSVTVE